MGSSGLASTVPGCPGDVESSPAPLCRFPDRERTPPALATAATTPTHWGARDGRYREHTLMGNERGLQGASQQLTIVQEIRI